MAQAPTAQPPPWSQRVLEGIPLSPFWTGGLLALGFLLVFFGVELGMGRFALYGVDSYREDLRVAVVLSLFAAYLPASWLYAMRSAERAAAELGRSLKPGGEDVGTQAAARFDRRSLRRAGMVGVGVLLVGLVLAESGLSDFASVTAQMSVEAYFHRILLVWIGWFGGRSAYATWVGARRFSRIGRERLEIDLLDLRSVDPLIRYGLRKSLITIGSFSFVALMFYDYEAAPNLVWFLLASALACLLLAAAALLMPLRGARDAIVREKASELARVNDEIRRARAGGGALPSLADWIAYRGLIEAVHEWPVDAPTLLRFALYLAIPLGSWFGGALVERMVDGLLG